MNGSEIAAKYSLPPNLYGYCGTPSFEQNFQKENMLEEQLKTFHAYKYLALIAKENNLGSFDEKVVRAFWIGNKLLNIPHEALQDFIKTDLLVQDPERARALSDDLPEGILPHHTFNVLYIQFVTDAVPRNIESFDSCCVTAAEVLSVSGNKAKVRRNSIAWDNGFALKEKEDEIDLERNGFRFIDIEAGDLVSVHWRMAIEKLDQHSVDLLEKYTQINLDICNNR